MGISVTKTGPYFASGEIKFSQLRTNFKETSSGEISASELFRNLNLYDRDPVTPDSTENDQIASDSFPSAGSSGSFNVIYGPQYQDPNYKVTKDLTAGAYATVFDGFSVSPVNRVRQTGFSGGNYNTVYGPAYSVSPVNRVKLQNGTYTFTYESYDVGTNTSPTLEGSGGSIRYSIGALITDTGISQIYEIKVEELTGGGGGTYEYTYNTTVVATTTATEITDATRRYTVGTLVSNTVNSRTYEIKVEERSGLYTFTENGVDVGTSTESEITISNGTKRYSIGAIVVNNPQSSEIYEIKIEEFVANNFTVGPFVFSGTGTNWKTSQFRNSIKRYRATQSGTDQFLDMGLKSGSGGIDWDGTNNLDASGVGGNYQRNVQKIIDITGICYSDDAGTNGAVGGGGRGHSKKAAAKIVLANPLKVINARIHIKSGAGIYGAGGLGGYFPDNHSPELDCDPGKDGGPGLSVSHEGVESPTYIHMDGGNLYGGGGGGEQGQQGAWPVARGTCDPGGYYESYGGTTTCTTGGGYVAGYDEGCHGSGSGGSCGPGEISASLYIASFPCPDGSGYGTISATFCYTQTCVTTPSGSNYVSYGPDYPTTMPEQGRGGRGGNGAAGVPGSPNYQAQTFGDPGKDDVKAVCNGGDSGANTATNSTKGESGNAGGQHGNPGESGDGPSPAGSGLSQGEGGGRGGAAICGKYFKTPLIGSTGANYVRGTVGLQCDGTESPEIPIGDVPVVTMSDINYVRVNYPSSDGTNTQTLNVTGTVTFKFTHIWKDKNDYGFGMDGFKLYDTDGTTMLYSSVVSVDFPQPGSNELPKTIESQSITLAEGLYPIEFVNLHAQNTGGTDSSGRSYLKTGNILESGHKLIFFDGDGLDRNQELLISGVGQSGQTPWVRSYLTGTHGSASDGNDWAGDYSSDYVGMNQYWSAFMREKAVWETNTDPKTQTSDHSAFQSWFFKPQYSGLYTLRAQSDNKAVFLKNGFDFNFETSEFDSSGTERPQDSTQFMVTGLDTDPNDSGMSISVTCTNSKVSPTWNVVNAVGHVPGQNYVAVESGTFKYYWGGVLQGTLVLAGASINYVQSADGNYRFKGGTLQADGTYSIERSKRSPELNWKENPAGVAWEMFIDLPDGSRYIACDSLTQAEGNVFGPAQINYTVTGVNPIDPTHQIAGLSSPTDPAFIVTNKLSDSVIARPYNPTAYSIRGKNGAGQTTVTKNIK